MLIASQMARLSPSRSSTVLQTSDLVSVKNSNQAEVSTKIIRCDLTSSGQGLRPNPNPAGAWHPPR